MDKRVSPIDFSQLDLGTGSPTYHHMDVVHAKISSGELLTQFAKAFVAEAARKNPLRAQVVGLTAEEVDKYCQFLLWQRVLSVKDQCKDWRKLKVLWIPCFVQHTLTLVGKVVDRQVGLTILPEMEPVEVTLTEAIAISEKIAAFQNDLAMVMDGMPRGPLGSIDLMSTALIADAVRSYRVLQDVSQSYISVFLGLKLQEEQAMSALYRIRYDDIAYIQQALLTQRILS